MTDKQMLVLQKSLTRSAKKAQKYYVRGLIGHTETEQGFFPIEAIPITNHFRGTESMLLEVLEDTYNYSIVLDKKLSETDLELSNVKLELAGNVEKTNKLIEDVEDLRNQIKDITTFNLG